VTYNYTGYPMVKQARHMVRNGQLGDVRKVIVEYNQGWLATRLEDSGAKQAEWRTDPARRDRGGGGRHRLARGEPRLDDHRP
jgi:predicted dehydrogenase